MNIDPDAKEYEFGNLVLGFGEIEDCQLIRSNSHSHANRCRVSVQYTNQRNAQRAQRELFGWLLGQCRLLTVMGTVQPYCFLAHSLPMTPIIVIRGYPPNYNMLQIKDHFCSFGHIVDIRRSSDDRNRAPRCVFILYDNLESACEACIQRHGTSGPTGIQIDVHPFYSTRNRECRTGMGLVEKHRQGLNNNRPHHNGNLSFHNDKSGSGFNRGRPGHVRPLMPGRFPRGSLSHTHIRPNSVMRSSSFHSRKEEGRSRRKHSLPHRDKNRHGRDSQRRQKSSSSASPTKEKTDPNNNDKDSPDEEGSRAGAASAGSGKIDRRTMMKMTMELNVGVPRDIEDLLELRKAVPEISEAHFIYKNHASPSSLHQIHGDKDLVYRILAKLDAHAHGAKILDLKQVEKVDSEDILKLVVKLCLKSLSDTAFIVAYRKDSVDIGHGPRKILRHVVEEFAGGDMMASVKVNIEPDKEYIIYVAPVSRFASLMMRAFPNLDQEKIKNQSLHFALVILSKSCNDLGFPE